MSLQKFNGMQQIRLKCFPGLSFRHYESKVLQIKKNYS